LRCAYSAQFSIFDNEVGQVRYIFEFFCFSIFTALVLICGVPAYASNCDINGKTLIVDFEICPQEASGHFSKDPNAKRCIRTRKRLTIAGNKVALHFNEIAQEGTLYTLGETVEVVKGDSNYKRVFIETHPKLRYRATLTAAYSVGQLRLQKQQQSFMLSDGEPFMRDSETYVFDIGAKCSNCALVHFISDSSVVHRRSSIKGKRSSILARQNSCSIRDGF
jgi:hypothetical protein